VKNLFGCIPGPKKPLWHLKAGKDQETFARILVDIYEVIRPRLTLLDGIIGMEGNGPNSGRPIPIGLILASGDSLSLDQIVCDLLGISREFLLTNRVAFEQGMGRDPIEVLGESVEALKVSNFQFPTLSRPNWNLPGFLSRTLKNALTSKPVIDDEVCESCNRCEEICPPKALARRGENFVFDYGKCIRCLCCLEVCPEGAISVKQGWAVKLVSRKKVTKESHQ